MTDKRQTSSNEELDAAQVAQLESLEAFEAAGDGAGGWKLGLTSGASRDAFGPGVRPFGFVRTSRVFRSGHTLWWDDTLGADGLAGSIENEVCFEFAETVSEDVDAHSVREALRGVAPAFELNQVRVAAEADHATRLADNLSNWGIVVGEVIDVPSAWQPEQLVVRLLHNADGAASVAAQDHIDDHFESLARLSNRLRRFGRRIEAGQKVITGAFGRMADPKHGLWSGDFGELGRVHVRIER